MIQKYPPLRDTLFLSLLEEFDLDQLERDAGTIYGLWPDLTLGYTNRPWTPAAVENGGESPSSAPWELGSYVIGAIAEPKRPFYIENYNRCLRESRPWEHSYRCAAAGNGREFHMTVFPLGQGDGLLVVNSPQVNACHPRIARSMLEAQYRNGNGIISQCCYCRRIRRVSDGPMWDWIPAWARRHPARTSHGLCAACSGFYYAKSRWELQSMVKPFSTICA